MNLYCDIETLPAIDPELIAEIAASVKPPATHKKQETIDAWMLENKESAIKELVGKTSFDGLFGRIACIAWAFDDGEVCSTLHTDSEVEAINRFYDAVREVAKVGYHGGNTSVPIAVVGHNVAGFDLPFLKHRSIIQGICPQPDIRKAMNAKPWDACIADTMLMWSPEREKRVSMDKLCKVFGIAGKGDFDGSMVAETWPNDPQKVIDYCKDDVVRTRLIYKRLSFSDVARCNQF